jgi:sugar phosphate permease
MNSPQASPGHVPNSDPTIADEIAAGNLRRRWLYLMPAVFVTYSLAYLDRANFGFGAAAGLASTLHITNKQTSLLAGLFFLGYFAFQVPGATLARKYSIRRTVCGTLIMWGCFAALTGVIRQFWLLALDRFMLGVAESLVFPVMLHLLTNWFTRAERSRANAFLMLGNPLTLLLMSPITGFLIDKLGWQTTFIVEGIPSILWGIVWLFVVKDRPSEAKWIPPRAAKVLDDQLSQEQIGIAPVGAVHKALLRGDVILLAVQYFFWSLGVYGFVLWLPTIVRKGAGVSMSTTGVLSAIPYLAAIIAMFVVSHISDRKQKRRGMVWPPLLAAGLALTGSFFLADTSWVLTFVCLVICCAGIYAPYGPFFAIIPERVPRNVSAEVLAFVNSAGALGGFFGSYLVGLLEAITGNARAGYLLMSFSLIVSALILLALREPVKPEQAGSARQ